MRLWTGKLRYIQISFLPAPFEPCQISFCLHHVTLKSHLCVRIIHYTSSVLVKIMHLTLS